jgi:glycerol-3-phosphate dehydrogenase
VHRDPQAFDGRHFDLVIAGGGMHGAWIALRAVEAGLSVALLEASDFGAGTSANSLKILHGGLRYLQSLDFGRMRSSIASRREFARRSPRQFEPLPCVMPLQAFGLRSPWVLGAALFANDLISADRNSAVPVDAHLPRGRLWSAARTRAAIDALAERDCVAGACWWDAVARDAGRLVLDTLHAACEGGAVLLNHAPVERILVSGGKACGVEVRDRVTGAALEIQGRCVVNATGPWAGVLARRSGLPWPREAPSFVGGLNLVLRRPLGPEVALALSAQPVAGRSGREYFFVPWRGVTMVGTDYCRVDDGGDPRPFAPRAAIDGLLAQVSRLAPRAALDRTDIALVHWGLLPESSSGSGVPAGRPFVAADAATTGVDGLVHVIAEKLTSAPLLSRRVLAKVVASQGLRSHPVSRRREPAAVDDEALRAAPPHVARRLLSRYGSMASRVAALAPKSEAPFAPLWAGGEVLAVEADFALREEMAVSLPDLVTRRLGIGDLGPPDPVVLDACVRRAAPGLAWDDAQASREREALAGWYQRNRDGSD